MPPSLRALSFKAITVAAVASVVYNRYIGKPYTYLPLSCLPLAALSHPFSFFLLRGPGQISDLGPTPPTTPHHPYTDTSLARFNHIYGHLPPTPTDALHDLLVRLEARSRTSVFI